MARFIVSRLGVPAINKDWYSTSDEEAIQKKNISTIVRDSVIKLLSFTHLIKLILLIVDNARQPILPQLSAGIFTSVSRKVHYSRNGTGT